MFINIKFNKLINSSYGIIIIISILIGLYYIYKSLKKEEMCNEHIILYFLMFISFSLIFGKLFTISTQTTNQNFITAGLSSYGGMIGAIMASSIFELIVPSNRKTIKYTIISLPLIYSISKLACFFAGCCYGIPYEGIFSIKYDILSEGNLFPVQMCETIVFFCIFVICNKLKNNKNINYIAILLSSTAKFLLDFFRYEHLYKKITNNQIFSIVLFIITLIIYINERIKLIDIANRIDKRLENNDAK